ncbi:MAG: alkaline phosphatase family protein, partial [Planctomycetota bacterium]|nr:alkaline phosphatase family protein [Planctomycetota bacterium]
MIDSRDSPPMLVLLRIGPVRAERSAEKGWRPMARAVHPGLASLGATFATGYWPERHGVVRGIEPHPDRLSLAPARPENRGIPAIWSDVVRAGRRAAVVGWPHDTAELESGRQERLAWTGRAATQPREEKAEHSPVLTGGLVRPPSRLPGMLDRRGEVDHDLTLELLEDQAKEGPDLLMGLVVDRTLKATPDATSERIRGIESRLAQARGVPPMVIEVRHPMPSESILVGPRFGTAPRIRVDGIGRLQLPVRPRVDAIASVVRGQLGVEPAPPDSSVRSGSGFRGDALDEAGLPSPRRLSIFQLKAHEQDLHREIG